MLTDRHLRHQAARGHRQRRHGLRLPPGRLRHGGGKRAEALQGTMLKVDGMVARAMAGSFRLRSRVCSAGVGKVGATDNRCAKPITSGHAEADS
ncbi:MAG: hypothetical protein ACLTSX_01070 [Collinsella sp.]